MTPLCVLLLGCSASDRSSAPVYTYHDDVRALLQARCVGCHGPARAMRGYDLSSWRGLVGVGGDYRRNAAPGDATSALLVALESRAHERVLSPEERRVLRDWVVDDRMAYRRSGEHPTEWYYPSDREAATFHGGALRAQGWDTAACKQCHDEKLSTEEARGVCVSCHTADPLSACDTCHGTGEQGGPPGDLLGRHDPLASLGVGAHKLHTVPRGFAPIGCDACHAMPQTVDAPGHLFDEPNSAATDFRAEVRFGERARHGGLDASYDRDKGTCVVYCHGAGGFGALRRPTWQTGATGGCNSCHPVPMIAMGRSDCSTCHRRSTERCDPGIRGDCLVTGVATGIRFIKPEYHIDGDNGLPTVVAGCHGCHGTAETGGAPGPDLEGKTEISARGVGLHGVHVSDSALRVGLSCDACHITPDTVSDHTHHHLDDQPGAEVTFGALATGEARGLGLKPSYTREPATCADVYCHNRTGASGGPSWPWTERVGVGCSSCHGYPTAKCSPTPVGTDCAACHGPAYQASGLLDPTRHINGTVEVAP